MKFQSLEASSIAEILRENYETALKAFGRFRAATPEQAYLITRAADVRRAIKARRDRDKLLPSHLFADPAWDMLLELYAAELEQTRLASSNLCEASAVPVTTALRWISTLANEGLIERHSDPLDGRRIFVKLSAKGLEGMVACFQVNPDR